jgi:hypothetical protein
LAHLTPNGLVEGILFNCSSPEVITAAMPVLRNEISSLETNVRIGAYSNGFINIFEEKSEHPISTKPKLSKGKYKFSKYTPRSPNKIDLPNSYI